jgi:protein tyrosine phosphatase
LSTFKQITDARDGQSRTIRQFQFAEWPEQGVPKSAEGFIDFIGQVHKTKEQFGQEGPITVHCSAGVGRTGVFIALSIVLARIQSEDIVDLFQTVRILRTQRPAMVQSEVKILHNFPLLHTLLFLTNKMVWSVKSNCYIFLRTSMNSATELHWNTWLTTNTHKKFLH